MKISIKLSLLCIFISCSLFAADIPDDLTNDSKKYDWLEKNEIKLIEVNEEEIPMLSKQFFADKFGLVL